MIIDGRTGAGPSDTNYDVIIIGGGPAGITLALELEGAGMNVALLESGGEDYDDDTQMLNVGRIEGNDDEYDLDTSRLRFLGGTSNHWGGHCTPLDPLDFDRAPSTGMSGWPFSKAALDPFYERAHPYCDLGAYRYDFAELAPQTPDYRLLADDSEVETAVLRQSAPTLFGAKYYQALERSERIHVWLWTNAVRIESDGAEGSRVDTQTLSGQARQFTGRRVVLAAGAIECCRLLMHSNAVNGTRFGDAGGMLGRCYMDHPSGGAAFIHFATPVSEMVYWSGVDTHADGGIPLHFVLRLSDAALEARNLPNFQYFVIPFADDFESQQRAGRASQSFRSLKNMAKWALGRPVQLQGKEQFSLANEYCTFIDGADEYVGQTVSNAIYGKRYRRALLKYEAEQRPDLSNFMTLDTTEKDALGVPRPVLTWAPSADDMEAVRASARVMGDLVGKAGIGRVRLEDHDDDPYWGTTTAWHQLGLMRMAESPTSGVVDANCRVHGTQGLYVASGAVFPTVGRANPTLTIVALTIRLADHLKEDLRA